MKYLSVGCLLCLTASVSAENRFVYVNNQNQPNTITAFRINSDGSLTQLGNSPFPTGGNGAQGPVESMAVVATTVGKYLYAANGGDGTVSALTIDTATGNIQPIAGSPFAAGGTLGNYDMAASPNHKFLFVTNDATTVIHVFAIAPETGALTEIPGSPFQANANIEGLNVTANNQFLIAAGNSNNSVEVFSITKSGALTQVTGSPFAASGSVMDVRSNCASDRVFAVSNSTNLVNAYSLSANGSLTPVPGSPFSNGASGSGPNSFDLALSPNSSFLFTTDSFTNDITSFAVAGNGALSQEGPLFNTAGWVGGAAITNRGDFLYSISFVDGAVNATAIGADGALTAVPGTPFGGGNISQNGEVNSVITYPPPVCNTMNTQ